jgi:hypothetical protein
MSIPYHAIALSYHQYFHFQGARMLGFRGISAIAEKKRLLQTSRSLNVNESLESAGSALIALIAAAADSR